MGSGCKPGGLGPAVVDLTWPAGAGEGSSGVFFELALDGLLNNNRTNHGGPDYQLLLGAFLEAANTTHDTVQYMYNQPPPFPISYDTPQQRETRSSLQPPCIPENNIVVLPRRPGQQPISPEVSNLVPPSLSTTNTQSILSPACANPYPLP